MEVPLRGHGGDGGATAVLVRCHGGHGGAAATSLRIGPTPSGTAEVLNIFKVSAVPPRRSAVLTVFGGATAINDGTTGEPRQPRRSWRCHCDLCRTSTAVAPRFRCDGGSTAEARRNMLQVSAVPPRRSAVLTVFRGATATNDGTTAEPRQPRRSWRCHCCLCRTSTAVAPRFRCDGGSTAEARRNMLKVSAVPPRRSAVLTVFRGATATNDGTTAEPRRSCRCHCGLCRTSTAVAAGLRCDGGIRLGTFVVLPMSLELS